MALQVTSVELYKESRKYSIGDDNISQTIKFGLHGNFTEHAGTTGDLWNSNDDHWVVQFIYDNFPWFREFPASAGGYLYLFLTAGEIEQVAVDYWIATLTYDIPDSSNSGTNQTAINNLLQDLGLGPGAGENGGNDWSEEFTQLSFNTISQLGQINESRMVMEVNKNLNLPAAMGIPALAGKPAPIGANEHGIQGTEIYKREFTFQITQYFTPQKLKYAYVRRLYRMTTCLNNGVFFGFPAGTVLFLGATASGHLMQNVPVTFEFAVRNNFKFSRLGSTVLSNPDVDDPNLMYDKYAEPDFDNTVAMYVPGLTDPVLHLGIHSGWAYVDYRYLSLPDTDAKILIQRPAFRIIHMIYEFNDFNKLQL